MTKYMDAPETVKYCIDLATKHAKDTYAEELIVEAKTFRERGLNAKAARFALKSLQSSVGIYDEEFVGANYEVVRVFGGQ